MKKILFLLLLLVGALIPVKAQFVSEPDVLAYLDGKTFRKDSAGFIQFSRVRFSTSARDCSH